MSNEPVSMDEKKHKVQKPGKLNPPKKHAEGPTQETSMAGLQKIIGNRAVQRLLAQRSGDDAYQLDDQTAGQIEQERSGGQPLDSGVQEKMGSSLDHDFSNVKVHTSEKSDSLNQQLGAEAFTTGSDVFFRQSNYNPGSSDGQKLIAHELTHVVQQSTGQVGGGGSGVTVGAPHDSYEQQADQVALQTVQRQAAPEEEEVQTKTAVQRQESNDDEEIQMKAAVQRDHLPGEDEEEVRKKAAVQRQAAPDDDKVRAKAAIQRQEAPEEEEVQMKTLQRQAAPEEEEVQTKAIQRQEAPEEEEVQMKALQREAAPEEEEVQTKALQREAAPEEEEVQTKAAIQREAAPEEEEVQTKAVKRIGR